MVFKVPFTYFDWFFCNTRPLKKLLNKGQHQKAAQEKQFSMLFPAATMAVVTLDAILQKTSFCVVMVWLAKSVV